MGSFNFRQNKNSILYIYDEDVKFSDISDEEAEERLKDGAPELVYDYEYMRDTYADIEEFIDKGMYDIGLKHNEFLYQNDDNYVTYDEFKKILGIESGYYEGFAVQLEDTYIDDFILQNKEVMGDIIKLYKDIYNMGPVLRIGKTCGGAGVTEQKEMSIIYE